METSAPPFSVSIAFPMCFEKGIYIAKKKFSIHKLIIMFYNLKEFVN